MEQPPSRWRLFSVVAVGVFMSTLDSSMVNIALPAIMREFYSPLATTEWVVMIYLLTITVSLLFWGHLGDRIGKGRIYPLGMLVFGAGSFFCAAAPQIYWLIFWRFCQAIGAAMMMATGPAIIKEAFPPGRLGRSLGLIGVAVSAGLMTGPALGGFLVEYYSWRSIFYVTVPISLFFALLATVSLPKSTGVNLRELDFSGSTTWALAIVLLILGVTGGDRVAALPLTMGLLCLYLFVKLEQKAPRPILNISLFQKRFFCIGLASALLSFAVLFMTIILMPFFLDRILNLSASRIGLTMMAIPLAVLVVAPPAGWLSDHIGPRYLTTGGLLLCTISLLLLAKISPDATPVAVAGRLALLGAGQAMFLSPNSASVLIRIKNHHSGVAAGLLATARNLGMLLGVALAGLIFTHSFKINTGGLDLKDFTPAHIPAFMTALKVSLQTGAAIGLGGVFLSWLRGDIKNSAKK